MGSAAAQIFFLYIFGWQNKNDNCVDWADGMSSEAYRDGVYLAEDKTGRLENISTTAF